MNQFCRFGLLRQARRIEQEDSALRAGESHRRGLCRSARQIRMNDSGLQVCAVDIDDGKLAHAKRVGADCVVNANRGSFVGTRQDMAEALDFAADGKVSADVEMQPLSAVNLVLDRLSHGDVASRVVLDFATR
jgi:D-arabinose 1-dehydrogenase-like Zn-dependent alcohol dehydrogenase